jgi:hypothetical protein
LAERLLAAVEAEVRLSGLAALAALRVLRERRRRLANTAVAAAVVVRTRRVALALAAASLSNGWNRVADEPLDELLYQAAVIYTGDTSGLPFNEVIRRAAAQYIAGGGGGGGLPLATNPAYIVGRWHTVTPVIATGAAAASGTVRLCPFVVRQNVTVSDLGARVTATGAGSFQLAIYANDAATMRPTGTVLARTGDILSTSAAAVSGDITGANVALTAGVYWAAVNVDATSAAAAFSGPSTINLQGSSLVGSTTLANVASAATNGLLNLTTPMAYNSWDDITAATFTEVSTVVAPAIIIKAA